MGTDPPFCEAALSEAMVHVPLSPLVFSFLLHKALVFVAGFFCDVTPR